MDKLIEQGIKVDAIITDPPYNIGKNKEWDKWDNVKDYVSFMGKMFIKSEKILKTNGSFLFFHNDFIQIVELQNFINKKTKLNFRQFIVWDKFNGGKSGDKGRVEKGILNYDLGADGTKHNHITIPCTHFSEDDLFKRKNKREQVIYMQGREVFKFAVNAMTKSVQKIMSELHLDMDEIDWIIPHQANMRIINNSIKKLGIPIEKVIITLDEYGNTSSASIPIALAEAYDEGKIKSGQKVVLVGFGGGLTWASTIIEWV
jgi:hypothetical protein